jgi:peptidylprolyl isomerase
LNIPISWLCYLQLITFYPKEHFMKKVKNGMFVCVEYTGTLQNGEVFDTSQGCPPLEIEMGAGQLIQGFEAQLMNMSLNEKKTFTVAPEDAYGQKQEDAVHSISRQEVPPEMDPQEGEIITLSTPDGHQIPAQVIKVDNESITFDLNHPLAGEALTFEIEVVGISDTPTQEHSGCGCGCGDDCGCESDGCSCGE